MSYMTLVKDNQIGKTGLRLAEEASIIPSPHKDLVQVKGGLLSSLSSKEIEGSVIQANSRALLTIGSVRPTIRDWCVEVEVNPEIHKYASTLSSFKVPYRDEKIIEIPISCFRKLDLDELDWHIRIRLIGH